MATVTVGSRFSFGNRPVVCMSEQKCVETTLAPCSSLEMKEELSKWSNCRFNTMVLEEFEEGDIVTIDYHKVTLCEIGKHLFFLYDHYNVKKGAQ